jgi:hypothetical protein
LILSDDAVRQLQSLLAESKPPVRLRLIFQAGEKSTSEGWVQRARAVLEQYHAAIPLAAGTNAFFAALNRQPLPPASAALPCYSLNPQVHASDDDAEKDCLNIALANSHGDPRLESPSLSPIVTFRMTCSPSSLNRRQRRRRPPEAMCSD